MLGESGGYRLFSQLSETLKECNYYHAHWSINMYSQGYNAMFGDLQGSVFLLLLSLASSNLDTGVPLGLCQAQVEKAQEKEKI